MYSTHPQKGSGAVTAIIVLVVIAIVAWLAYNQGLFQGDTATPEEDGGSLEVNVGASS